MSVAYRIPSCSIMSINWSSFVSVPSYPSLAVDSVRMDGLAFQKIGKRHFFQKIQSSFKWVTGIGLKPPQFFSF